MLKLIQFLLFGFLGFSFAAGAPPLTDVGAGAADAGSGDPGDGADGAGDLDLGDPDPAGDPAPSAEADDDIFSDPKPEPVAQPQQPTEEQDVANYAGMVSGKIRAMVKAAPELGQVFQKYPQLKNEIEARFRREAAFRDAFPTVAEANQMREHFPNGLADVQALQSDVQQLEALDKDFYSRDAEGHYSGHPKILSNMFTDDREAAVSFVKSIPKEWARQDPDSYNEVMGRIVGSTLQQGGIPEFVSDLITAAKEAKQDGLAASLGKLLNWANGYTKDKPAPSQDEQRLQTERQNFKRETSQRDKEEGSRFHQNFLGESRKLQLGVINNHPAMKRLEKVTTISAEKREQIASKVRVKMEQFLAKSPSFMRKLKPAHASRNLNETINLQKAAWSQPWLLNKMIRDVLRVETPAMVQNNRDTAARRSGQPVRPARPANNAAPGKKGPYQENGRWYRENGQPFSGAEILSGKHLSQ